MSAQELYVIAAHKFLSAGKKSLSVAQTVDLFAQVLAVDLGLKSSLLYDSNSARAEQVQQYLSSLQSSQLVSKSLLTLNLSGNTLIVNPVTARLNIEQLLHGDSVAVIDVCHKLKKPAISETLGEELKIIAKDLLILLRGCEELKEAEKPLDAGEKCEWNLCTVFGLLLGYPVTYWFDQNKSFENCLSMTPLSVTTASVTWQVNGEGHRCRLFSFSVPTDLLEDTQYNLKHWNICLQDRFQQQNVLTDLTVCQTMVTLPSVCL